MEKRLTKLGKQNSTIYDSAYCQQQQIQSKRVQKFFVFLIEK